MEDLFKEMYSLSGKLKMKNKNVNQVMSHYLGEMLALKHRDVPPNIDAYCSVLKDLFSLEYQ